MCLRMQALSLGEASLPRHLHTALFTQSTDNRLLTHRFVLSDVLPLLFTLTPNPPYFTLSLSLS